MELKDALKFANDTPVCYLATAEGDQPRVRALGFWFADETGFYFSSEKLKDMYRQLRANPKVEACFWQPVGGKIGTMMRVAGEIEFVDDPETKKKLLEDRPSVKEFSDHGIVIFRIAQGEAYFWTWATNFEPKEMIKFGN